MSREEADTQAPAGVLAILTDEHGRVAAAVADFDRSGYGGFTLARAQEIRVRTAAAMAMVKAYASPALTRAISAHDCDRIMERLCREHGYRLTVKAIGHSPEDTEDVER